MSQYTEGKKYLLTPTGTAWSGFVEAAGGYVGGYAYFRGDHFERAPETGRGTMTSYPFAPGCEYDVTPVDPEPTELRYLYSDGTEFTLEYNPEQRGYVFSPDAMMNFLDRIGVKPAPEKYEPGEYVDQDGDTIYIASDQRVFTFHSDTVEKYARIYGPLVRKDEQ